MSFHINQMPASSEKKMDEDEIKAAKLKRFKIWFAGIVFVCFSVIAGSAVFYYQLGY